MSTDPGAASAAAAEVSLTSSTTDYVLAGALGNQFRIGRIYNDGDPITYWATDDSGQSEIGQGVYSAGPNTVSRDTILLSSTGAKIDWPASGQRIIRPLASGIPLCPTPPTDGQVLVWDAEHGDWCPRDIADAEDDDTADMQDVTSGTTYAVPLNKVVTQVVWRSPVSSPMFTNIPGSDTGNNGYSLDIKTTMTSGQTITVTPASGTIGGLANWTFADDHDGGCNMFLRSDGVNHDWVIRCICCVDGPLTPPPPPPPPVIGPYIIAGIGSAHAAALSAVSSHVTTATPPGPMVSSVTASPFSFGDILDFELTDTYAEGLASDASPPNRLIAWVYVQAIPATPNTVATVVSVTDDHGLIWTRRSAFEASIFSSQQGANQRIRFETWWTDSSAVPAGASVTVTANFGSAAFVPSLMIYGMQNGGDWNSAPAQSIITDPLVAPPSIPLSTTAQSMVFAWYVTPEAVVSPLFLTFPAYLDPGFGPYAAFEKMGLFFNLNQQGPTVTANSSGFGVISMNSPAIPGPANFTRMLYPTTQFPKWSELASLITPTPVGPHQRVADRGDIITDESGADIFICNNVDPGIGGVTDTTEPTWDISVPGAVTVDNGLWWNYVGTEFPVAPVYLNVPPRWSEPYIGRGHSIPNQTKICDSLGRYIFTAASGTGPGIVTGATEPAWNTSALGAVTADGMVSWSYSGPAPIPSRSFLMIVDAMNKG